MGKSCFFASVTVKGHLLALGGEYSAIVRSKEVRQYNPDTDHDSWQVVSQMRIAHYLCAAAFYPDNKLLVVGE